jgi:TolB-like protein
LQPHRQLLADGERVELGKRALDILSVLANAQGEIVTKDELLDAVWPGVTVEENALKVHVVACRKALGPEADRLKTIRAVGYRLELDGVTVGSQAFAPVGPRLPVIGLPTFRGRLDAHNPQAARFSLRPSFWMISLVVFLLIVAGSSALFGDKLALRGQERIPVVVRTFSAENAGNSHPAAFASGITEEIIIRLRRIPELRVASANSDGNVPSDSFADAHIVDGSVRSSGDNLRVTAQLLDARGEILWSQSFDRKLAGMFDVQEQIAAAIASSLSVSFDVGADATEYGGTDEPEAYAAFLQFRANQLHPDQRVPQRYLERALSIDPDYVHAIAGLSVSYALQANGAPTKAQALALMDRMDKITARAVQLRPNLWAGHMARGGAVSLIATCLRSTQLSPSPTSLTS